MSNGDGLLSYCRQGSGQNQYLIWPIWTFDTSVDMATSPDYSSLRGNYKSYSVQQKKRALDIVSQNGLKPTARTLKIPPSTLRNWKKKFATEDPFETKNPGSPPHYPEEEKALYSWILSQRDLHIPVTRAAIMEHFLCLVNRPEFSASSGWLKRFLKRHGLSLRCQTTTAQHLPEDLNVRARIFLRQVEEVCDEYEFDEECVINMDETPVYFDLLPGKTIDKKGTRDVIVRSTGKRFPKDITKVPDGIHVEMHPNAWMTQEIMGNWISKILRPYTMRRPTLLIMDSFAGHTTDKVNQDLWKVNAVPVIIPGGCTSKIQPLDVSINKPFKSHLRQYWTTFIKRQIKAKVQTASRQILLTWILDAWNMILEQPEMIQKSFSVTGITGAAARARQEVARRASVLNDALYGDDTQSSFAGFTAADLPIEPEGYNSDPFLESDDSEDAL